MFSLQKIALAKEFVQPILSLQEGNPPVQNKDDEALEELTRIVPFRHRELPRATKDRGTLRAENDCLKKTRDRFDCFSLALPGGGRRINLKLSQGRAGGTMFEGGQKSWTMQPPLETPSIPLASMSGIRMLLADEQISFPHGPLFVDQPVFTADGAMILQCGSGVEAVFLFDDLNNLQDEFLSVVWASLIGNGGGPLADLTMRLGHVSLPLESPHHQKHLERLSIDFSVGGTEEAGHESEEQENLSDVWSGQSMLQKLPWSLS